MSTFVPGVRDERGWYVHETRPEADRNAPRRADICLDLDKDGLSICLDEYEQRIAGVVPLDVLFHLLAQAGYTVTKDGAA